MRRILVPLVVALVLAGCGSGGTAMSGDTSAPPTVARTTTSNPLSATVQWMQVNGSDFDALRVALNALTTASSTGDPTAMVPPCTSLLAATTKLAGDGPIPDPTVEQHWSAVLADYRQAANACLDGAQKLDGDLLMQSAHSITDGNAELDQVIAHTTG